MIALCPTTISTLRPMAMRGSEDPSAAISDVSRETTLTLLPLVTRYRVIP